MVQFLMDQDVPIETLQRRGYMHPPVRTDGSPAAASATRRLDGLRRRIMAVNDPGCPLSLLPQESAAKELDQKMRDHPEALRHSSKIWRAVDDLNCWVRMTECLYVEAELRSIVRELSLLANWSPRDFAQ